ncbi:PA-phosphatase-like phosphoesterase [Pedobacter lusitanus]|uniref:PA-phosphatase-like phosphoesterase n=1 Tax=Pedobacter lusitanus TaxID=1503925 RepID=A0A0D0GE89_9SPHI|nr:phosphatase PAP2 family protein [Pedobacter lusitanus]KIO74485.1 PA-phosphatase-like phosphoesterase [Pedobacter lusitanus]
MTDQIRLNRPFFSWRDIIVTTSLSFAYLLISYLLIGFKSQQVVLIVIFNSLYYASQITRKFILGFSIFIVYWIIFDYMKAFPNYAFNKVHIAELYHLEKQVFGILSDGTVLTPNEYWRLHGNTALDVIGGIFYLMWIPVPMAFAGYLFFANRKLFIQFLVTFVLVNLIGFVIYYLYPAAPPWYVQYHGFVFEAHTAGNTAGLAKFDHFFNAPIFKSIYSNGSNVFAAMPSLHSSYPVIVLYFGLKNELGPINIFFGIVTVGIWFTAVYTSHHYVLDVIAGITCAIVGISLFGWLAKHTALKVFLEKMYTVVS